MILKAWGVSSLTPLDISRELEKLRVSHSNIGYCTQTSQYVRRARDFRIKGQGKWPVVLDSIAAYHRLSTLERKKNLILYVFCSKQEILHTNLDLWIPNKQNLRQSLIYSLTTLDEGKEFKLEEYEPTLEMHIDLAARPSALSDLQTAYYKINPYEHRKQVQEVVILYLASEVGESKLERTLRTTLRGEELLGMLNTVECQNLKEAITYARAGNSVEEAAAKFNVEGFDISYILNSIS